MKKKKLLALVMAMALAAMALAGCSSDDGEEDVAVDTDSVVIKVGYENNAGDSVDEAVKKWANLLSERSGGTMTMEMYPSGKLAARDDLYDRIQDGKEAVITLADSSDLAEHGAPEMSILYGPYLFDSWDEVWRLQQSDWWKTQQTNLEQEGMKVIASNWIYGDRHLLTTKPVNTAADLKGMKVRVPDNDMQKRAVELMGAEPVTMALGEVSPGLKDKSVEGLENPLTVLYDGQFHQDAKYLLVDSHMKNFTTWVCSTEFFNTLTKEQQDMLMETGKEAGVYNNELQDKAEKDTLQKMKDEGVTVKELTPEERTAFQQASQGYYTDEKMMEDWPEDLYNTVMNAMGRA